MLIKYFRKAYTSFATYIYDIPPRMLAFLLIIIFALLPLARLDVYTLTLLTSANVMAIFAASWDLLVGRTGQISLGHSMFYGAGAYGSAALFQSFGWPFWVTIPVSMLISAGIALLIGFPCLRVKGPYLALVTMCIPLVIAYLLSYFSGMTGGQHGLPLEGLLPPFFPDLNFWDKLRAEYYLTLSLMAISAIILYKIANSKTGMTFVSILDDELACKACGINVTKYKLMAFTISGIFASLAGCINAYIYRSATPPFFDLAISITPLVVTILGGIGTIYGPLVGTYIYFFLDGYVLKRVIPIASWQYFGLKWEYAKLLIFLVIVVIFIIKWPRGIGKTTVDKLEDLEEAREIDEIEKRKAKTD
jgi:branched-chain amino acid transport system permease protein